MINTVVIGASGYTGAELVELIHKHSKLDLAGLYVSENSLDKGKPFSSLYPRYQGVIQHELQPLTQDNIQHIIATADAVLLALPHQASHHLAATLVAAGKSVFDLSGAYRLSDTSVFETAYGFTNEYPDLNEQAVYGLAEWNADEIAKAKLIAVPGCYPTASLTALKPLQNAGLLDCNHFPVINAVSGVSGAGRKASLTSAFCEVSLNAYGVLGHRHQPEISEHLGCEVIFTPHLGNFKRGILATITVKVNQSVSAEHVAQAYESAYKDSALIRLSDSWPTVQQVQNTACCDLHWKLDESNQYLIVCSAIDNLLKGAASQAVQCINIHFGFADSLSLSVGEK